MERVSCKSFCLRQFIVGQDEALLLKALSGPEVVRHMASSGIDQADCQIIIKDSVEHWKVHGVGSWAVEVEGQVVGWAGFKFIADTEYEILIVLEKGSWGLGREIRLELIRLARDELGLKEVFILLPNTRGSFRYIERLGFKWVSEASFNGATFQKFVLTLS